MDAVKQLTKNGLFVLFGATFVFSWVLVSQLHCKCDIDQKTATSICQAYVGIFTVLLFFFLVGTILFWMAKSVPTLTQYAAQYGGSSVDLVAIQSSPFYSFFENDIITESNVGYFLISMTILFLIGTICSGILLGRINKGLYDEARDFARAIAGISTLVFIIWGIRLYSSAKKCSEFNATLAEIESKFVPNLEGNMKKSKAQYLAYYNNLYNRY